MIASMETKPIVLCDTDVLIEFYKDFRYIEGVSLY